MALGGEKTLSCVHKAKKKIQVFTVFDFFFCYLAEAFIQSNLHRLD